MSNDRDWRQANRKRDLCRICGHWPSELAHVIGRVHDKPRQGQKTKWVNPDSVVPLCREHHGLYDAHRLDLLPFLELGEQVQAVSDAGGISAAVKRICSLELGQLPKAGFKPPLARERWQCPGCGAEIPAGIARCLLCGFYETGGETTREMPAWP